MWAGRGGGGERNNRTRDYQVKLPEEISSRRSASRDPWLWSSFGRRPGQESGRPQGSGAGARLRLSPTSVVLAGETSWAGTYPGRKALQLQPPVSGEMNPKC